MRFLFLSFIFLKACPDIPYDGKMICTKGKAVCDSLELAPKLDLIFEFAAFTIDYHKKVSVTVFCKLDNTTDSIAYLDRNAFSVSSSSGLAYILVPFPTENKSDTISTLPGTTLDHLFIFNSSESFSKDRRMEILKKDTFYFIRRENGEDTLFKIVANDKRIK